MISTGTEWIMGCGDFLMMRCVVVDYGDEAFCSGYSREEMFLLGVLGGVI